jgi:hypothetical protein
MRSNLKTGTAMGNNTACVTSTLAWVYGPGEEPAVSLRVEQVAWWFDIWQLADATSRERIRKMWVRTLTKLGLKRDTMWSRAKGPISATICTLYEAGWSPLSPTRWLAKDSVAIVDGSPFNKARILAQLQKDLIAILWAKAGNHIHSAGITKGADMQPAKRAKASLLKEGNFAAAKALDYAFCGAIHDAIIKNDKPKLEQFCTRCDLHVVATRKHVLWECRGNESIENPFMRKSRWTCRHAKAGFDEWTCLYTRDVVPSVWRPAPNEVDYLDAKIWESSNFVEVLNAQV